MFFKSTSNGDFSQTVLLLSTANGDFSQTILLDYNPFDAFVYPNDSYEISHNISQTTNCNWLLPNLNISNFQRNP